MPNLEGDHAPYRLQYMFGGMEEQPKHLLSILRLPHSATVHLIDCVSDLSSIRVVNSLCYVLSSSLGLCACVCCGIVLCVRCFFQPYSMLSL
jgi:hypothetical protein